MNMRNNVWKWLALLIIAIFSFYIVTPLKDSLRFGLDLKGGASFTLGVDEDRLREMVITRHFTNETALAELARDPSLTNATSKIEQEVQELLRRSDERVVEVVRRRVDGMGMNEPVIQSIPGKHRLLVQLPGFYDSGASASSNAVERSQNAMSRTSAKDALLSAAFLEFRLLHPDNEKLVSKLLDSGDCPEGYVRGGAGFVKATNYNEVVSRAGYAQRFSMFHVREPRWQFVLSQKEADGSYRPNFVSRWAPTKSRTPITGDYLTHAAVSNDEFGRLAISFTFNSKGAELFGEVTRNYMANGPRNKTSQGRQLAILLDGQLVSAPTIQSEIRESGQITGRFTLAEAQELANNLNAGALPAPLTLLSESFVSPTVGADAMQGGLVAAGLGFTLVALFMLIYYWYAGLVADIALFLDIVLLPAALVLVANVLGVFAGDASMGGGGTTQLPVLTMPGIAGLVLTLGMAVDANVIIFERIREEFLYNKASVGTAVKTGYGRAFTAILDSNITTIVTGVILFVVGTGPVRGFAITLTGGVIISMFTAVVVTRLVFEHTVNPDSMKPFKMLNIFKKTPHVDFVKSGKVVLVAGFAGVAITCAIFFARAFTNPASVLAVDLTGGTSLVYSVAPDAKPAVGDVRKALDAFDNATTIQYSGDNLLVKTGYTADNVEKTGVKDVAAHVTKLLQDNFKDAKVTQVSVDEIGSVVGADLKRSGAWAVCLSLVAILVYVAFRFEFGFGLGAIVALIHDALISLGLFSLCGSQVSLLVITALLTIIGYSVNDTIVVFDRIREDLRKDHKTGFKDLCNRALNECLSRTVITSLTTFFAVVALFAFGDGSIFDFALTMIFGVVAGTISSVFIATPVMMWFYKGRRPQFSKESGE